MGSILLKAFSFVLIIIIGYVLKRIKLFGERDYKVVSRIVMNITLPCALITGFAKFQMDKSLFVIVLMGLCLNLLMSGIGLIMAARKDKDEKVFNMLNLAGYNIGCFTLPFVQSFLGAEGVGVTSLFDTGNSIMCTGGTYAIACMVKGDGEEKPSLSSFIKKIFSSVPFDTYLLMFIITLLNIKLPDFIFEITSTLSAGNAFLSMLMIGLVFECNLHKEQVIKAGTILVVRYGFAVLFALGVFYLLPFAIEVKRVLVILLFSPIPALAPIFTSKCNGDGGLAGVINSICIPISIGVIISLLSYWQI